MSQSHSHSGEGSPSERTGSWGAMRASEEDQARLEAMAAGVELPVEPPSEGSQAAPPEAAAPNPEGMPPQVTSEPEIAAERETPTQKTARSFIKVEKEFQEQEEGLADDDKKARAKLNRNYTARVRRIERHLKTPEDIAAVTGEIANLLGDEVSAGPRAREREGLPDVCLKSIGEREHPELARLQSALNHRSSQLYREKIEQPEPAEQPAQAKSEDIDEPERGSATSQSLVRYQSEPAQMLEPNRIRVADPESSLEDREDSSRQSVEKRYDELVEPLRDDPEDRAAAIAYLHEASVLLTYLDDSPESRSLADTMKGYQQDLENYWMRGGANSNQTGERSESRDYPPSVDMPPRSDEELNDLPDDVAGNKEVEDAGRSLVRESMRQRGGVAGREKSDKTEELRERMAERQQDLVDAVEKQARDILENFEGTEAELADQLAVFAARLGYKRNDLEQVEIEKQQEKSGRFARLKNLYRHNRKFRIGTNVALAGVAAVGSLTGVGAVVGAAFGAKLALRAASGFWGGEAAHDYVGGKLRSRHLEKDLENIDWSDAKARADIMARVNSPHRRQEISQETFERARQESYNASVSSLRESLNSELTDEHSQTEAVLAIISQEITANLEAANRQLEADRKINRARRAAGALGAVVGLGVGQALQEASHLMNGGGHTPELNHSDASGAHIGEVPRGAGHGGVAPAHHELHRFGGHGEGYTKANYIIDPFHGHEEIGSAVGRHLNNITEYHKITDPHIRELVRKEVAKRTLEVIRPDGTTYWRIPKSAISHAIFNHLGR